MKLAEILECQKTLRELDDCVPVKCADTYALLDALYDLRMAVDEQADKYAKIHNRLLKQYGVECVDKPGSYDFTDENREKYLREQTKLDESAFSFERREVPKFEPVTPRQYRMLREFFDFI